MNRTDRLLAIVLELQGKGKQRAVDLAATFEVSKRTIYRDIEALCQAGVPIASAPGQGYLLVEGYFLPPLSFSSEEAVMLLLGSRVMSNSFDSQYRSAAASAGRKIAGVLSERLRDEVAYLQAAIHFIDAKAVKPGTEATLQKVRRAIIERHTVSFGYYARFRSDKPRSEVGVSEARKADPYALVHVAGSWYMVAYCRRRQDIRNFRLDRIEGLAILEEPFTRPQDFKPAQDPKNTVDRTMMVRALFTGEAMRWVRETPSFYTVAEEQTPGGLLVTLAVRHEREVLGWLLGWGRHVRVLEPASLRCMLAEEAELVLRRHQAGEDGEDRENGESLLT